MGSDWDWYAKRSLHVRALGFFLAAWLCLTPGPSHAADKTVIAVIVDDSRI